MILYYSIVVYSIVQYSTGPSSAARRPPAPALTRERRRRLNIMINDL